MFKLIQSSCAKLRMEIIAGELQYTESSRIFEEKRYSRLMPNVFTISLFENLSCFGINQKTYIFLILNLSEFPTTKTSESAIATAAIMGFRNPAAATGMARIL